MPRRTAVGLLVALLALAPSVLGSDPAVAQDSVEVPWVEAITPPRGSLVDNGVAYGSSFLLDSSDDGSRVLFHSGNGLEVADEALSDNFVLADIAGQAQEGHAALSGDGRFVATVQRRSDANGRIGYDVLRWDIDGGRYDVVDEVRTVARFIPHVWISTSGRYLFHLEPVGGVEYALTRVDALTGATRTIGFPAGSPDVDHIEVSGDGRYVLYLTRASSTAHRLTVATGVDVALGRFDWTFDSITAEHLALSPSGRYATYGGHWYDVATGATIRFTDTPIGDAFREGVSVADNGVVAWVTDEAHDPADINETRDVYAWSPTLVEPVLVSVSDLGTVLTDMSPEVVIAGSGRRVVFESLSPATSDFRALTSPGALYIRDLERGRIPDAGIVDAALRPIGGYWMVDRTGVVHGRFAPAIRVATRDGVRPVLAEGEQVTGIAPTRTGLGYWLFTTRGRVLPYGDAGFFGDLVEVELRGGIVDAAVTPTDAGYLMVGADGGAFAFGDAAFVGSVPEVLGGVPLAAPVVSIAPTPSNLGYRMVAADGGIFSFGDAPFFGSVPGVLPGVELAGPIIGIVSAERGYLNIATDGGVFNFGDSPFHGSLGGDPPPVDVVAVIVLDALSGHSDTGYVIFDGNGGATGFGSGTLVAPGPA